MGILLYSDDMLWNTDVFFESLKSEFFILTGSQFYFTEYKMQQWKMPKLISGVQKSFLRHTDL